MFGTDDTQLIEEMLSAFNEIQMPRTPYALKQMVVESKYTPEQQYAQCVLELSIAYDNLRTAQAKAEIKKIEINRRDKKLEEMQETHLVDGKKIDDDDIKIFSLDTDVLKIELEQLNRARLGAMREFDFLFNLWKGFPTKYTRADLNEASPKEYQMMLETQAQQDLCAMGRVSQGNQEGLRQIGRAPYPQIEASREVEKRYLETGQCKMIIAVPTEKQATDGIPCIEKLAIPSGVQIKILNVWGRKVDDAYNYAVQQALEDKADYLLTVEDDTFPEPEALIKLMEQMRKTPNAAIGAWYPKREETKEGVHIIIGADGKRQHLPADGQLHKVYTLAMGCTLYPIEMFMKTTYPWFKTTENLSQDSFFSQIARDAGYDLLVDTAIKCKHVDRETGTVYE